MAEKDINKILSSLPKGMKKFAGVERMSTGSVIFDLILGGGIPVGASIGLAAEPGIGKSTLMLHAAKHIIAKTGRKVVYLDYEKGVTPSLIEGMGLKSYQWDEDTNPDGKLIILLPATFEDGEQVLDAMLPTGEIALVIIDSTSSVSANKFVSQKDRERVSVTSAEPGIEARIWAQWVKKYVHWGNEYGTSFVYIQQVRTKISFIRSSVEASGGYGIKHGCHVNIMMRKLRDLERTEDTVSGRKVIKYGAEAIITAYKNKYARPYVEAEMTILFGKGISNISTYIKWMNSQETELNGKKVPMIRMQGAGYYTVVINGKEYKARGDSGVMKLVQEHIAEIKALVDASGGFQLIAAESTKDE